MINQGVTAALAACDANTNGVDSYNSGTGARRNERAPRECTYPDFMKCQPLNFKGTEGVVELTQWIEKMETVFCISNYSVENQIKFSTCTLLGNALTWWNSHVRTVGNDIAYAMTWTELKKKILTRGTGSGQKPTCFECGVQGHFKRECPKLMNNNNRGNQVGGGNALAKVYAVGHVGINPDSNIVMDSSKDFQRLPNHEPSSLSKKDKLSAVTNKKQRFQLVEAKLLSAIKIVEIRYSPQEKPNVDADGLKAVRTRSHIKDSTLSHDYRVLEKVGSVAYKLELPEELSRVHNTFHVSNLKKHHADKLLAVPLDGLHFDDKLQFVEEPVEIMDREVKRLKRSRIPLVKVRWNSKRGPEFTWERDQIQFRRNTTPLHKTAPSQVPRL
ncbi:putative reverse transcriptase domain-containing protein [Tanacetum coccineum]